MPFQMKMKVANEAEVMGQLRQCKASLQRSILRGPMGKIARLASKEAKARAPVLKDRKSPLIRGLLKKSIGSRVRTYKSGVVVAIIGPQQGFLAAKDATGKAVRQSKNKAGFAAALKAGGTRQDPIKYTHLLELGTSRAPAQPFLRPALEAVRKVAGGIMRAGVQAGLDKAVAKGKANFSPTFGMAA